ncbi:hypothetical protein HMPREF3039_01268 [Akkermansia sp. KLE1798]|nr:hypothetical protein HMPREF3039_01268 [Akkermansia sp. KLE1798]KZA04769.1 hypothetical protein HMPREF1326_01345 [Akkermansia sp. KLE1605]
MDILFDFLYSKNYCFLENIPVFAKMIYIGPWKHFVVYISLI